MLPNNFIASAEAELFASQYTSGASVLVQEAMAYTLAHHPKSHMASSFAQLQLLQNILSIAPPTYVLEIGTFTGVAALAMAEVLPPHAQLHTIEIREEDANIAQHFFDKSNRKNQLILHRGNAATIIETLPHTWDFVFIDADKTGYIQYYDLIVPRLSKNGSIVADNVLFHGQVWQQPLKGKNPQAIVQFLEHVQADARTSQVLLTVRDGVLWIRKN